MVQGDLKQLEAIANTSPFVGALDLATFAKDRHVVRNATCSLADLCAVVLGKCLSKNISERTTAAWENVNLTPQQLHYAACDAYVPLLLYHELSKFSIPQHLPSSPTPSMHVLIYNSDHTVAIAVGRISAHPPAPCLVFDGVPLSARDIIVDISDVLVPGAILLSHRKQALKDFGPPPFTVVCKRIHLRQFDALAFGLQVANALGPPSAEATSGSQLVECSEHQDCDENSSGSDGMGSLLQSAVCGGGDTSADSAEELTTAEPSPPHDTDSESHALGTSELGQVEDPGNWSSTLRSRVLKDIFHVFNMLRISTSHGLRKEFARALRDTIFVPDQEDRMRISAWAAMTRPPMTFEQLLSSRPNWLWRHCQRSVPPPDILFPLVKHLFTTYGPLKDAATKLPLFNAANWKAAKQILELICQGFISDPPGIPLYSIVGLDAKAGDLPIYRCSRGTNFTEGGVHSHLRSRMPTSGASVRHANASLCDFVLQHNLRVCISHYLGYCDSVSLICLCLPGWYTQQHRPTLSWPL